MITFILFVMGAFVMWRVMLYLWCDACGKNVRDSRSQFCARCRGDMEVALEKILNK